MAPSISRDVENVIRNVVRDQINRLLNTDANKRRVEDLFAPILTAAGVSHIRSLTVGEGGIASILF